MTNSMNKPITIDSVLEDMTHWRKNKAQYDSPGIPNEIWKNLFYLAGQFTPSVIKKMFGLNSQQYKKKYNELISQEQDSVNSSDESIAPLAIDFAKVTPIQEASNAKLPGSSVPELKTKAIKKKKVANYIETSTIIIECIRPDGYRLNIHSTMDSIRDVMQAFFNVKDSQS